MLENSNLWSCWGVNLHKCEVFHQDCHVQSSNLKEKEIQHDVATTVFKLIVASADFPN